MAAVLAVQNSHAQTNSATNSTPDIFVKPKAKTQTNVLPGPDGLIRLEAKPELVDKALSHH